METTKICKPGSTTIKKAVLYLLSILLWMVLWQIAAVKLSKELFLPTPIKVFSVLLKDMIPSKEFWFSIKTSLFNIDLYVLYTMLLDNSSSFNDSI